MDNDKSMVGTWDPSQDSYFQAILFYQFNQQFVPNVHAKPDPFLDSYKSSYDQWKTRITCHIKQEKWGHPSPLLSWLLSSCVSSMESPAKRI